MKCDDDTTFCPASGQLICLLLDTCEDTDENYVSSKAVKSSPVLY